MMFRTIAVACAWLGVVVAQAAAAQNVTAADPSSVAAALQGAGYRAELTKDDDGDPLIKSSSSGTDFLILFYACTRNVDCRTVQFYAGYSDPKNASLASLNQWNGAHRFGRAYLTDKGSARIEMDVDLDAGGMSRALFSDNVTVWTQVMARFESFIYGH